MIVRHVGIKRTTASDPSQPVSMVTSCAMTVYKRIPEAPTLILREPVQLMKPFERGQLGKASGRMALEGSSAPHREKDLHFERACGGNVRSYGFKVNIPICLT